MAPPSVLDIKQVTVRYGPKTALADVAVTLGRGVTGLLGANGAGKTTLIRVLAGALRPDHGEVVWSDQATGYTCGYMPQEAPRTALLGALDYVRYLGILTGVPRREVQALAREAIVSTGLESETHTRVNRLSGGMFRRLMLAAALVGRPEVLLLDEPTVGLDPLQRDDMLEVLERIGRDRVTLLSSHLLDDIGAIASSLLILRQGEVAYTGSLADLTKSHEDPTNLRSAVLELMRTGGQA